MLLTVCIAVMVGGHGRVATAHQIAPWCRGSDLLSPTAVGAAFRSTSVGGLSHFQSDMGRGSKGDFYVMGIAQRRQLNLRAHRKLLSAEIRLAGHGYGAAELWA